MQHITRVKVIMKSLLYLSKGQLISKGHFLFSTLLRNERKFSAQCKNLKFQVRFVEELKTQKRHFEIN